MVKLVKGDEVFRLRVLWPLCLVEVQRACRTVLGDAAPALLRLWYADESGDACELSDAAPDDLLKTWSEGGQLRPIRLHLEPPGWHVLADEAKAVHSTQEEAEQSPTEPSASPPRGQPTHVVQDTGASSSASHGSAVAQPTVPALAPQPDGGVETSPRVGIMAITASTPPTVQQQSNGDVAMSPRVSTSGSTAAQPAASALQPQADCDCAMSTAADTPHCGSTTSLTQLQGERAPVADADGVVVAVAKSPDDVELQKALDSSAELASVLEASKEHARARLDRVLEIYGATLRPVQADGNCQYRAISAQLYGEETHHGALRSRAVEQLRCKRDRYAPYVHHEGGYDDYLTRMARDGEWGDNVSLQALSDALGCEIRVLTDVPGSDCVDVQPLEPSRGAPQKPLCLAFLTELHFDAVEFRD